MTSQLTTASVTSRLTNQPGRTIVTARGHHFVVDSPAPLGGPNEELNPIDLLLSALATCGTSNSRFGWLIHLPGSYNDVSLANRAVFNRFYLTQLDLELPGRS